MTDPSAREGDIMHSALVEIMRDEVSTIYRAVTGTAMPGFETSASGSGAPLEAVTRSFAELEALVRTFPVLAERIPPFSFAPPLDVLREGDELIVELAVPGVEREDVTIEQAEDTLVICGIRRVSRGAEPGICTHGEIPWGPFYRSVHIPFPIHGEPGVDMDRGLLRVRLKRHTDNQQLEATERPALQE
jgi:HSP20 family molecular chaperone IbpA